MARCMPKKYWKVMPFMKANFLRNLCCSVIQNHTKAPPWRWQRVVRPSMMSSKLCVCVPRRTGFPRSRWLYNDSGAVGLLFFQLMLLGKFVDGDNDIFGYVFQLCIHSVSFLQKYGLFRGTPMFLFFFCSEG